MIRGVVFDFGGVMTTATMPERVRRCVTDYGIGWDALERGYEKYRRLMDGGFISFEEMYDLIWADADISITPELKARIYEEDLASFMDEYRNLATLDWMRRLKCCGLKIGILTNMSAMFEDRFRAAYPEYFALADASVISGREHMFKPQRRIYDLFASRIALPAAELCFVDDVEGNCEGARRAGWQAVRFTNNSETEAVLERLLG